MRRNRRRLASDPPADPAGPPRAGGPHWEITLAVIPLLTFTDECTQAIETYVAAFDAEIDRLVRFRDAPDWTRPRFGRRVMLAELTVAGHRIRMSDALTDLPIATGTRLTIRVELGDALLHQAAAVLGEGGTLLTEVTPTGPGSSYAMIEDRFGVVWELASLREN